MATQTNRSKRVDPGTATKHEDVLESLYSNQRLPCPVGCGGAAEVVRVSTVDEGAGSVWTECRSCAQRSRYRVPPATDAERRRVARGAGADRDPACPRHVGRIELRRRGRQLFCPACGVRFRD